MTDDYDSGDLGEMLLGFVSVGRLVKKINKFVGLLECSYLCKWMWHIPSGAVRVQCYARD